MPAVRIRVGAASDGTMATVFRPLIAAARQARTQIRQEFKGLAGEVTSLMVGIQGPTAKAAQAITVVERTEAGKRAKAVRDEGEARKRARQAEVDWATKFAREQGEREAREADKSAERQRRTHQAAAEHVYKIKQDYLRREEQASAASAARQQAAADTNAKRTGYWSMRYMDRALRGAGRFGMSVAQGAGVDLDIGRMVGRSVDMEKQATDLSNASYQPGAKGAPGQRVAASAIIGDARAAGNAAALDPAKALEGMRSFVSVTGDLALARSTLKDLAVLSRATGTGFEDMVAAAGEAASKMGDVPNKGEKVLTLMRALAGQGKLGAVEIRDMAREMAKVGASANQYNMSPEQAMAEMGILMQGARQSGGAVSASVAANSAAKFTSYVASPKGLNNLSKAEMQPFANKNATSLLNPETIILASLSKTKGNLAGLGSIFRDSMAMRSVTGYANLYNRTQGNETDKLNAVRAEFDKFRKITMGQAEVSESFKASMETSEAKIQLLNNKLSELGGSVAERIVPQLLKLEPTILAGVDGFARFAAWAADNPGKAVAAALAASIARAQVETVVRAGIEKLLNRPGAAGAMGTAGAAFAIAATAITIAQVGMLSIDKVLATKEKAEMASEDALVGAVNARQQVLGGAARGNLSGADVEALKQRQAELGRRVSDAQGASPNGGSVYGSMFRAVGGQISAAANYVTGGAVGTSGDRQATLAADAQRLDALREEMARNKAVLDKIQSGVLKVQIVGGGPAVSGEGRSK